MFLNNRTDTPNRYAATRAASATAATTGGLHVGTYKVNRIGIKPSSTVNHVWNSSNKRSIIGTHGFIFLFTINYPQHFTSSWHKIFFLTVDYFLLLNEYFKP